MDFVSNFLNSLLSLEPAQSHIGHYLLAVIVTYAGGVLSSLTPCVYPMIPITVSVVGGISGHSRRSWKEVLFRIIAYMIGMTLVYSFLGVAAGLTGKIFGSFTNTSGWYLFLGIILTLASLMMLEVIRFDPSQFIHKLKRSHTKQHHLANPKEVTHLGAFFLGISSGFIATPCTTPALTSVLAFIAQTQSVGVGLLLMFSFSLGLSTILLLIGLFTGALQILPKSGKWLEMVKLTSGLILLAFAGYLIYRSGQLSGV
ncbi:MAG: sulfite exporter TauE/SafE family protein [Bdellovibrio sp.]|nr:sulfite exporter TauE/SafE family protein [Bdellovibrio sp.]